MPTWIRCKDPETGHEFDLSDEDLRVTDGSVEVIKDYPENTGLTAQPRAPKYHVSLPRAEASAEEPAGTPPAGNPAAGTTAKKTKE